MIGNLTTDAVEWLASQSEKWLANQNAREIRSRINHTNMTADRVRESWMGLWLLEPEIWLVVDEWIGPNTLHTGVDLYFYPSERKSYHDEMGVAHKTHCEQLELSPHDVEVATGIMMGYDTEERHVEAATNPHDATERWTCHIVSVPYEKGMITKTVFEYLSELLVKKLKHPASERSPEWNKQIADIMKHLDYEPTTQESEQTQSTLGEVRWWPWVEDGTETGSQGT